MEPRLKPATTDGRARARGGDRPPRRGALPEPRALVARLQRARARARRGRPTRRCSSAPSSSRSTRRTSTSSSWCASPACTTRSTPASTRAARRPVAGRDASSGSPQRARELSERQSRQWEERTSSPRWPSTGIRIVDCEQCSRRELEQVDRHLRRADLPRAHAARGRARAAVPLHLEPLADARRLAARPGVAATRCSRA